MKHEYRTQVVHVARYLDLVEIDEILEGRGDSDEY